MSAKMKGLLKGLRHIPQMFDNEKEGEIQIGYPTDVKHVAHIGWEGPSSTNSGPSWMNEFKLSPGFSSAPLGIPRNTKEDGSVRRVSEDLTRRCGSEQLRGSPARDLPELPKSSRWQSSSAAAISSAESPTKLKSEKSRQPRRSLKGSSQSPASECTDETSRKSHQAADHALGSSSTPKQGTPNKSRRKKPKESSVGESSRSSTRSKSQATSLADESTFLDTEGGSGPLSVPKSSGQFDGDSKMEGVETLDEKGISRRS